jgi:S-adenosyl-L-methionine hydrolase (adenosine-forming)
VSRLVAFLSDYGLEDEFVGVCHAVISGICPDARVLDITHGIAPHDVRSGALALLRAVQYLPEDAVVLAVVDPGVGTPRRCLALRTEGRYFVGPDNGLLSPAVAMVGGALDAVVLDSPERRLPPLGGGTFDGRDVFAPAAAFLAAGVDLSELGTAVDTSELVPLLLPLAGMRPEGGELRAQVLWVDRFGNAQLNVSPEELKEIGVVEGGTVEVSSDGMTRDLRWVSTYGDAEEGEVVLLVDSYGLVSVACNRRRAVDMVNLGPGAGVTLRRAAE